MHPQEETQQTRAVEGKGVTHTKVVQSPRARWLDWALERHADAPSYLVEAINPRMQRIDAENSPKLTTKLQTLSYVQHLEVLSSLNICFPHAIRGRMCF